MWKSFKALYWTFGVSFLFAMIFYLYKDLFPEETVNSRTAFMFLFFKAAYMWIPGLFAFLYAKKEKISLPIISSNKIYYFYAILTSIVLMTIVFFLSLFYSKVDFSKLIVFHGNIYKDFLSNFFLFIFVGLIGGSTINLLFAFGEEVMWRGFLWEKIKFLGFWKASITIGFLWGVWYFPIVFLMEHNYPVHQLLGSLWMIILCVLTAPLYLYLRIRSESILAPSLLNGMLNTLGPITLMICLKPNAFLVGFTGIAGFISYLLANVVIYYLVSRAKNLQVKA